MSDVFDRSWFTLPGRPVPYSRTATVTDAGGKTRRVNPTRYRDWRKKATDVFNLTRRGRTFAGPVSVDVVVFADRILTRITAVDTRRPTNVRGDLDNYAKAVLDAAQSGNVIANDRQVVALTARFADEAPE